MTKAEKLDADYRRWMKQVSRETQAAVAAVASTLTNHNCSATVVAETISNLIDVKLSLALAEITARSPVDEIEVEQVEDAPTAQGILPDLTLLPPDALLTRNQMVALSGFSMAAFRKWAREDRGPAITFVQGRPRYRVETALEWLRGHAR